MKQNNTNKLFKSLALCFLILGNLTFEVLCAPAAAVTVVEGKVVVPKDARDAINKHYKVKSTEDFFQSLIVKSNLGTTEYKFPFNSPKTGQEILAEEIKTANKPTAQDAFNAFKTKVETITKAATGLKNSVDVNVSALEIFMFNFKFEGGKFVLTAGNEGGVTLNDIADNLVVYLNCTLEELIKEVGTVNGADISYQATLDSAQRSLANAEKDANSAKQAASASASDPDAKKKEADTAQRVDDAKSDLATAIFNARDNAKRRAFGLVISKVKAAFVDKPTGSTPAPTTLKALLDALNKYHIKTEYEYTAVGRTEVTYSIVNTASTSDPKISVTQLKAEAADIDKSKIFLSEKFIDTENVLAKDVFLAISEKCPGTDANACFKAILKKISSTDFGTTVDNALSKTVTEAQFNDVFKPFATESVKVEETDIGERKIKLCWLSNVTDLGLQFSNYITWLEGEKKLVEAIVADKAAAIKEFFKVLQDNLAAYKTKLEGDLKSKPDQTITGTGGSAGSNNGTGTRSKTKTIIITIGGVVLVIVVGGAGFFTWYFYFKEKV